MSSIDSKRREYKTLKDYIDEKIKEIATAYENSMICFQDQKVINIITVMIENGEYGLDGLLKKVGDAKEKSAIEGYDNTERALSDLKEDAIKDLSVMLDELRNEISHKSNEAYEELSSSYANLNQKYTTACANLDTNFKNYNTYDASYNYYCDQLKINRNMTAYVDKTLLQECENAKNNRKNAENQIETDLKNLNKDIKAPLEQLLKDGLKKTNNIGGSNPSVFLPNGTTASLY